jgi:hypothetical protein
MYGFNYEVTLGIEIFDNCITQQDINTAIKKVFPNSNPESITPIIVTVEDFWKEVNDTFDYRGDNYGVSLTLDDKQETELGAMQGEIINFINNYLGEEPTIYSLPFLEGVPGYPVFWEYRYAILDRSGTCLFFYGSSSD